MALDRKAYQPGERLALGGWLRTRSGPAAALSLAYCSRLDYCSATLGNGHTEFSPTGGFCLDLAIPSQCKPGQHKLKLSACNPEGELFEHTLEVRVGMIQYPPLTWSIEAQGNTLRANGRLLTGEPIVNAPVSWVAEFLPFYSRPARTHGFFFGHLRPRWCSLPLPETSWPSLTIEGRSDAQGNHTIAFDPPAQALAVRFTATLTAPDRRRWSCGHRLALRGCQLAVGLRVDSLAREVSLIVCDLEGNLVSGVEVHLSPGDLCVLSQANPMTIPWSQDGWISARVRDESGLENSTQLPFQTQFQPAQASLWVEQESYRPGETARVWVYLPEPGGLGLLQVLQGEPRCLEQRTLDECLTTFEVPVDESMVGGVGLRLDVVSTRGHQVLQGDLMVACDHHHLWVDLRPLQAEYAPDSQAEVAVRVRDAQGVPQPGAEVFLLVLDEAAEASCGSGQGDPLSVFYARQPGWLNVGTTMVMPRPLPPPPLVQKDCINTLMGCGGFWGDAMQAPVEPLMRRHFQPLASWQRLVCDERGQARATFRLPSQATRYVIRALACVGTNRFGAGRSSLVARPQSLTLRVAAPRFLWQGDQLCLSVFVQNSGTETLQVRLYGRAAGLAVAGPAGWSFELAGAQAREFRLKLRADGMGLARVQWVADFGTGQDAVEVEIPVRALSAQARYCMVGQLPTRVRLHEAGEVCLTLSTPDPADAMVDFIGDDSAVGLALKILVQTRLGDRLSDMRSADRRRGIQRGGYHLDRLPELITDLLGQQFKNGAFCLWEGELAVGQSAAAARLQAYLSEHPELLDDSRTHEVVGQAHHWAVLQAEPPGREGLHYWVLPAASGREPAGRPGSSMQFATAGLGLQRLWGCMPLLAARVEANQDSDYFALWGGSERLTEQPRGIVRVVSGAQPEAEVPIDDWLRKPQVLRWRPDSNQVSIAWEGQGQIAFRLETLGPVGPGPLRVRRTLSVPRNQQGDWLVPLGAQVEMKVTVEGVPNHFRARLPYPAGFDVLDSPGDLGGVLEVDSQWRSEVTVQLRAVMTGRFCLPPAWVWAAAGSHGLGNSDVVVVT